MAHYAFLDENNIVTEVITGVDEDVIKTDSDGTIVGGSTEAWEEWYGNFRGQSCKRTSINTRKDNHAEGKTPFRKNYAQVGFQYDPTKDAFIRPQPFESWSLNEDTCDWESPIPIPSDWLNVLYKWDEETLQWVEA
jgi:hypothetical protein